MKTIILLLFLLNRVIPNKCLMQLKNPPTSDSPLLMKILQSVDAATSDEHLFHVTLKLLKSLCLCMRETLIYKEKEFEGDGNSIAESENEDGKILDIYKKIYNHTCFSLNHDVADNIYKPRNWTEDEHSFLDHTNCGRRGSFGLHKNITKTNKINDSINNIVKTKYNNILFQALVQTKGYHKYKIKRYNLFGKAKPYIESNLEHSIIVILTLYPIIEDRKFKDQTHFIEVGLNNTLHSNSPIDIDIIDTKYDPKSRESEERSRSESFLDCNLQSIYVFLIESEKNNFTKVFRLLQKQDTIKIYIDVTTEKNHIDYSSICCKNNTIMPLCKKLHTTNVDIEEVMAIIRTNLEGIDTTTEQKPFSGIKDFINFYTRRLNKTDNYRKPNKFIKKDDYKGKSNTENLVNARDNIFKSEELLQLSEVTQALLFLNDVVIKQTTKMNIKTLTDTTKFKKKSSDVSWMNFILNNDVSQMKSTVAINTSTKPKLAETSVININRMQKKVDNNIFNDSVTPVLDTNLKYRIKKSTIVPSSLYTTVEYTNQYVLENSNKSEQEIGISTNVKANQGLSTVMNYEPTEGINTQKKTFDFVASNDEIDYTTHFFTTDVTTKRIKSTFKSFNLTNDQINIGGSNKNSTIFNINIDTSESSNSMPLTMKQSTILLDNEKENKSNNQSISTLDLKKSNDLTNYKGELIYMNTSFLQNNLRSSAFDIYEKNTELIKNKSSTLSEQTKIFSTVTSKANNNVTQRISLVSNELLTINTSNEFIYNLNQSEKYDKKESGNITAINSKLETNRSNNYNYTVTMTSIYDKNYTAERRNDFIFSNESYSDSNRYQDITKAYTSKNDKTYFIVPVVIKKESLKKFQHLKNVLSTTHEDTESHTITSRTTNLNLIKEPSVTVSPTIKTNSRIDELKKSLNTFKSKQYQERITEGTNKPTMSNKITFPGNIPISKSYDATEKLRIISESTTDTMHIYNAKTINLQTENLRASENFVNIGNKELRSKISMPSIIKDVALLKFYKGDKTIFITEKIKSKSLNDGANTQPIFPIDIVFKKEVLKTNEKGNIIAMTTNKNATPKKAKVIEEYFITNEYTNHTETSKRYREKPYKRSSLSKKYLDSNQTMKYNDTDIDKNYSSIVTENLTNKHSRKEISKYDNRFKIIPNDVSIKNDTTRQANITNSKPVKIDTIQSEILNERSKTTLSTIIIDDPKAVPLLSSLITLNNITNINISMSSKHLLSSTLKHIADFNNTATKSKNDNIKPTYFKKNGSINNITIQIIDSEINKQNFVATSFENRVVKNSSVINSDKQIRIANIGSASTNIVPFFRLEENFILHNKPNKHLIAHTYESKDNQKVLIPTSICSHQKIKNKTQSNNRPLMTPSENKANFIGIADENSNITMDIKLQFLSNDIKGHGMYNIIKSNSTETLPLTVFHYTKNTETNTYQKLFEVMNSSKVVTEKILLSKDTNLNENRQHFSSNKNTRVVKDNDEKSAIIIINDHKRKNQHQISKMNSGNILNDVYNATDKTNRITVYLRTTTSYDKNVKNNFLTTVTSKNFKIQENLKTMKKSMKTRKWSVSKQESSSSAPTYRDIKQIYNFSVKGQENQIPMNEISKELITNLQPFTEPQKDVRISNIIIPNILSTKSIVKHKPTNVLRKPESYDTFEPISNTQATIKTSKSRTKFNNIKILSGDNETGIVLTIPLVKEETKVTLSSKSTTSHPFASLWIVKNRFPMKASTTNTKELKYDYISIPRHNIALTKEILTHVRKPPFGTSNKYHQSEKFNIQQETAISQPSEEVVSNVSITNINPVTTNCMRKGLATNLITVPISESRTHKKSFPSFTTRKIKVHQAKDLSESSTRESTKNKHEEINKRLYQGMISKNTITQHPYYKRTTNDVNSETRLIRTNSLYKPLSVTSSIIDIDDILAPKNNLVKQATSTQTSTKSLLQNEIISSAAILLTESLQSTNLIQQTKPILSDTQVILNIAPSSTSRDFFSAYYTTHIPHKLTTENVKQIRVSSNGIDQGTKQNWNFIEPSSITSKHLKNKIVIGARNTTLQPSLNYIITEGFANLENIVQKEMKTLFKPLQTWSNHTDDLAQYATLSQTTDYQVSQGADNITQRGLNIPIKSIQTRTQQTEYLAKSTTDLSNSANLIRTNYSSQTFYVNDSTTKIVPNLMIKTKQIQTQITRSLNPNLTNADYLELPLNLSKLSELSHNYSTQQLSTRASTNYPNIEEFVHSTAKIVTKKYTQNVTVTKQNKKLQNKTSSSMEVLLLALAKYKNIDINYNTQKKKKNYPTIQESDKINFENKVKKEKTHTLTTILKEYIQIKDSGYPLTGIILVSPSTQSDKLSSENVSLIVTNELNETMYTDIKEIKAVTQYVTEVIPSPINNVNVIASNYSTQGLTIYPMVQQKKANNMTNEILIKPRENKKIKLKHNFIKILSTQHLKSHKSDTFFSEKITNKKINKQIKSQKNSIAKTSGVVQNFTRRNTKHILQNLAATNKNVSFNAVKSTAADVEAFSLSLFKQENVSENMYKSLLHTDKDKGEVKNNNTILYHETNLLSYNKLNTSNISQPTLTSVDTLETTNDFLSVSDMVINKKIPHTADTTTTRTTTKTIDVNRINILLEKPIATESFLKQYILDHSNHKTRSVNVKPVLIGKENDRGTMLNTVVIITKSPIEQNNKTNKNMLSNHNIIRTFTENVNLNTNKIEKLEMISTSRSLKATTTLTSTKLLKEEANRYILDKTNLRNGTLSDQLVLNSDFKINNVALAKFTKNIKNHLYNKNESNTLNGKKLLLAINKTVKTTKVTTVPLSTTKIEMRKTETLSNIAANNYEDYVNIKLPSTSLNHNTTKNNLQLLKETADFKEQNKTMQNQKKLNIIYVSPKRESITEMLQIVPLTITKYSATTNENIKVESVTAGNDYKIKLNYHTNRLDTHIAHHNSLDSLPNQQKINSIEILKTSKKIPNTLSILNSHIVTRKMQTPVYVTEFFTNNYTNKNNNLLKNITPSNTYLKEQVFDTDYLSDKMLVKITNTEITTPKKSNNIIHKMMIGSKHTNRKWNQSNYEELQITKFPFNIYSKTKSVLVTRDGKQTNPSKKKIKKKLIKKGSERKKKNNRLTKILKLNILQTAPGKKFNRTVKSQRKYEAVNYKNAHKHSRDRETSISDVFANIKNVEDNKTFMRKDQNQTYGMNKIILHIITESYNATSVFNKITKDQAVTHTPVSLNSIINTDRKLEVSFEDNYAYLKTTEKPYTNFISLQEERTIPMNTYNKVGIYQKWKGNEKSIIPFKKMPSITTEFNNINQSDNNLHNIINNNVDRNMTTIHSKEMLMNMVTYKKPTGIDTNRHQYCNKFTTLNVSPLINSKTIFTKISNYNSLYDFHQKLGKSDYYTKEKKNSMKESHNVIINNDLTSSLVDDEKLRAYEENMTHLHILNNSSLKNDFVIPKNIEYVKNNLNPLNINYFKQAMVHTVKNQVTDNLQNAGSLSLSQSFATPINNLLSEENITLNTSFESHKSKTSQIKEYKTPFHVPDPEINIETFDNSFETYPITSNQVQHTYDFINKNHNKNGHKINFPLYSNFYFSDKLFNTLYTTSPYTYNLIVTTNNSNLYTRNTYNNKRLYDNSQMRPVNITKVNQANDWMGVHNDRDITVKIPLRYSKLKKHLKPILDKIPNHDPVKNNKNDTKVLSKIKTRSKSINLTARKNYTLSYNKILNEKTSLPLLDHYSGLFRPNYHANTIKTLLDKKLLKDDINKYTITLKKGKTIYNGDNNNYDERKTFIAVTKNIRYNTYQPTTKEDLDLLYRQDMPVFNTLLYKKVGQKPLNNYISENITTCVMLKNISNRTNQDTKDIKAMLKAANCSEDTEAKYNLYSAPKNILPDALTKNFETRISNKDGNIQSYEKNNLYQKKITQPKYQRKIMKGIQLGNRRKKLMTMNTEDFFLQRRFITQKNIVRHLPKTRLWPPEYKPIGTRPRFMILRPKFKHPNPGFPPIEPKPSIMKYKNDFSDEDALTYYYRNTFPRKKMAQFIPKSIPKIVSPMTPSINVLERPFTYSRVKPRPLRDRIDIVRRGKYLFDAQYEETTQKFKPRDFFKEKPLILDISDDEPISGLDIKGASEQSTVTEWWLDDMYLKVRLPLPINSNPGMVFPRRTFAKLEEVADLGALFIDDLLDYKEMLDRGELPLERASSREKGQPLCMEQFYRLLGVCRIPEVGRDTLEFPKVTNGSEELEELIVVACRNYFYPVPVKAADRGRLTPGEIQAQLLHAMVDASGAPRAARVGLLTAMGRDQWARARDQLLKDEGNRTNMELISRALCILCLDEGGGDRADVDPDTNGMLRAMHGAGTRYHSANRWFDKTVQLIISSDGTVGMCYEHSAAEGVAVVRLAERALARAEVADRPAPPPALLPAPQAMRWTVSNELNRTIDVAARDLDRAISDLDFKVYTYRGYGREFMKACRTSPDVYIQLAMQYAYYKMYGCLVTTYESASLRRFRNGRVDNIRSAHGAALAWAAAMCTAETPPLNENIDDGQKKVSFNLYGEQKKLELFEEAARKQTAIMEANILGRGIDNHLLGLREAARETLGELPQIFTDDTYKRMIEYKLSTSQVATTADGTFMGYGAVCPDGYGCSYNPKKECIIFCISSFVSSSVTNTEAFRQSLEEALDSMKLMFQARKVDT